VDLTEIIVGWLILGAVSLCLQKVFKINWRGAKVPDEKGTGTPGTPIFESGQQFTATCFGGGLRHVYVKVKSHTTDELKIVIPEGTVFLSDDDLIQNMVCTSSCSAHIDVGETKTVSVRAACLNMRRAQPTAENGFQELVRPSEAHLAEDFKRLLHPPWTVRGLIMGGSDGRWTPFTECSSRIQQFAIWIITDNPRRSEFAGISRPMQTDPMQAVLVELGVARSGPDGPPSDAEIQAIKTLFCRCRIRVQGYRVFEKAS
jgi:hypothetical protein